MYRLECTCGNPITITPRQAGSIVTCDRCSQQVPVPKLGQLRQLPRSEEPADSSTASTTRGLGAVRGTVFAICLLLTAIGGTLCIVAAPKAFFQDLPPTPQEYVAENRAVIDTMSPVDLLQTWKEYEQMGLGPKTRPEFYRQRLRIERWQIVFWVAAAVTALSILGLVASGRRRSRPAAQ